MQRYQHDPDDDADRRLHEAEEALQEAGMSAETGLPGDVTRPDEDRERAGAPDDGLRDETTDVTGA